MTIDILDAGYDALLELVLWGHLDVAQDRATFVARIRTRTAERGDRHSDRGMILSRSLLATNMPADFG